MSEHPNAERIRTIYQLSGGGDVDAFADALADDVVAPRWRGYSHGCAGAA